MERNILQDIIIELHALAGRINVYPSIANRLRKIADELSEILKTLK